MQADDADEPVRSAAVIAPLAVAVASAALGAVLVLTRQFQLAGVAAAVTGGSSLFAGLRARESGSRPLGFADASADRVLDAVVLGAVAWGGLPDRPVVTAAALAALGSSYLASYLAAKGTGLGFPLEQSILLRGARWAVVSLGLLVPSILPVALSAVAVLSVAVMVVESRSVARRKESRRA